MTTSRAHVDVAKTGGTYEFKKAPGPEWETDYKACRKGDATAKAVAVSYSSQGVLADASEITGLPRDEFDVWESRRWNPKEYWHALHPEEVEEFALEKGDPPDP